MDSTNNLIETQTSFLIHNMLLEHLIYAHYSISTSQKNYQQQLSHEKKNTRHDSKIVSEEKLTLASWP